MSLGIAGMAGMQLLENMHQEEMQKDTQNFNADQASRQQSWSSGQAGLSRDWQEMMSNTQYQRATADMQAAGLNPMLAYHQGGAGVPSGATATGSAGSASTAPKGNPQSIPAAMQSASQIEVNDAITERTRAEAEKIRAEEKEVTARTPTHAVSIDKMNQQIEESKVLVKKMIQETTTGGFTAANIQQQTVNLKALLPQIRAMVDNLKAQTTKTGVETGLTGAHEIEARQRIKENLPQLEAAIKELEAKARLLEMPKRGMDAAANESFLGSLGAVLRTLNPLGSLTNIGK